jgi:glycosyltransferase involved in cell wall biosynthesis
MFFDDDRVIVQYNPVDRDDIIKKGNEKIDLIPNSFLQLGTIGRLEEQKGFTRLIDCVGKLKEQDYKFSLWIVGEGSLRGELEAKIKEYSLEDYVKLVGFHSNPYKYMSKCNAFICSSYAEGFSTSATEALILGKPIFTTDCAGMNELFGGEKCGEIVPNTDEGLYDMLENLASGKWQPQDYTQAVQNRIDFFDIKERIKEIEGILDN